MVTRLVAVFVLVVTGCAEGQDWTKVYQKAEASVARLELRREGRVAGLCTATSISTNSAYNGALFLTAKHCIVADELFIGGKKVVVLAEDTEKDVALVKFEQRQLWPYPALKLRREGTRPGEPIAILGCPFGTVKVIIPGVWGSVMDKSDGLSYIVPTGALGISGGAVVDGQGRLLSIYVATLPHSSLGVAVPREDVERFLRASGVI